MTRPIAARLREVCATVQQHGPCDSVAVAQAMTARGWPMTRYAASQYCCRAVTHGLMEVDTTRKPQRFTTVHDWRELVDQRPAPRKYQPKAQPRFDTNNLQRIWA